MSKREKHSTKPEDRVPIHGKIGYGFGMTAYAMMIQSLGQMANVIFNIGLGVNPVYIGWIMGGARFWDAITDPVMGNITDNTRSRWGRRRPWIALGGLLCGISFAAIWLFPRGMSEIFYVSWFLVAVLIFFLAFTVFSVPYIALGMEMSPDYHERTSVIAFRSVMAQGGGLMCSCLFWFISLGWFTDMVHGMRFAAIIMGIFIFVFCAIPAIFAKEHSSLLARQAKQPPVPLLKSAKATLTHPAFLIVIGVTAFLLIGTMMVGHLGAYVCIYHVFNGVKNVETGKVLTIAGSAANISALVSIPLLTLLSKQVGKQKALLTAMVISLAGTILKWVCYTPAYPYLQVIPSALIGSSLAAIWMLVNAMIPDIVDADELKTGTRREGMFGAVYSWAFKLGVVLALIISGYLLSWSGFDANLESQSESAVFLLRIFFTVVPSVAIGLAILLTLIYPLTEKRSYEIRKELEARRGS